MKSCSFFLAFVLAIVESELASAPDTPLLSLGVHIASEKLNVFDRIRGNGLESFERDY